MRDYTQEFKDQVVELHLKEGRTFMDLAKEFSLSPTTIANWTRAVEKRQAGKGSARSTDAESDRAKIARLEREVAQKTEELEILGKALAFFVRRRDR
jgi:transposase